MRLNILLMVAMMMSFGTAAEARDKVKLGIKTSMSLEEQLKRLQVIGFDCKPRSRDPGEHWQCTRSSQVVNLSPRRILVACADDSACWSKRIDLIRDIAPRSTATVVKPVTLYRSEGSVHLHCLTLKGSQSVCAQSWAHSKRPALEGRFVRRSASSVRGQATGE
jgi:hypothetical protein